MPPEADADKPKLIDAWDALFSMYNTRAEKYDEKMINSWKSDSDSILVFSGLLSAAVAQFLVGSLQVLQLNSQDASSFYLARIYQLTPSSNASFIPLPPDPARFQTPKFAVWTNTLWSLSLAMSLSCALLATMLQQWTRRYLRITQRADDPQRRARIRELMLQGLRNRFRAQVVTEALTALLHVAVFLFLAGFVIYLFHLHPSVGVIVASFIGSFVSMYLFMSIAPIISPDSPYYTPLSSPLWDILMRVTWLRLQLCYAALRGLGSETVPYIRQSFYECSRRIAKGFIIEVEDMAHRFSSLDGFVLLRTFNSLDGDHDMDQFLAGIPGFYSSAKVKRDSHIFERLNSKQLPDSVISFLDRSLSSNLLPGPSKRERIKNCLKAINSDPLLLQCTFRQALSSVDSIVFKCPDFVLLSQAQVTNADPIAGLYAGPWTKDYARCIVAVAINRISDYNDKWAGIIRDHLGFALTNEEYPAEAESVRLANLVQLIRQLRASQLNTRERFTPGTVWHNSLSQARELDVANAAQGRRNEFCALWNELADVAQGRVQAPGAARLNTMHILSVIRSVFIPLHGGVEFPPVEYHTPRDDNHLLQSAPFYLVCADANHR